MTAAIAIPNPIFIENDCVFIVYLLCIKFAAAKSLRLPDSAPIRVLTDSVAAWARIYANERRAVLAKFCFFAENFLKASPRMSHNKENRVFCFADFSLQAEEHLLTRNGERISLTPRAFALLVTLVENAGHLLEKERLINEVWADSIVEEGNLNQTISKLRKALGEKRDDNRFIETVPRVGYRFIAPVEVVNGTERRTNGHAGKLESPVQENGFLHEREKNGSKVYEGPKKADKDQKRGWLFFGLAIGLLLISLIGLYVWRNWESIARSKPDGSTLYEPVRLTSDPSDENMPRWTQDGRIRYFRILENRNYESWVMDADGSNKTRFQDLPNLQFGFWSPDGTKVLFSKPDDSSSLYLANADGTGETVMPFATGRCDWSPDSKQIVYYKKATSEASSNPDIFVYSTESRENRNLTNHPDFEADPTFSPDGKQIAFVSTRDGNAEIYLVDNDGSNVRRLTNHPAWDNHPVFSPDGTQLAFTSDRERETSDVYIMSADGRGEAVNLTPWDKSSESIQAGGWSPDGTKLAIISDRNGNEDIYSISAEAIRPTKVLADERSDLHDASYSPDGRQIVYRADLKDKTVELRVFDVETNQHRMLLRSEYPEIVPRWSPDGAWIAFQNRTDGNSEIWLIKPDGSGLKNLTNNPAKDVSPSWSPDAKQIVFASNRDGNFGIFQLYAMNADGTDQHRIYYSNASSNLPSWSPDSREIIFENDKEDNRRGNFEIFSIEPGSGKTEKRLTFRRRFDGHPVLSPNGERIAFVSNLDGNSEIYVMSRDGTNLRRITRNTAEDLSPHWSPDGKSLLFTSDRARLSALYQVVVPE